MATLARARVRSDHEAAWAHRHQRATDAVMQTFARDLRVEREGASRTPNLR